MSFIFHREEFDDVVLLPVDLLPHPDYIYYEHVGRRQIAPITEQKEEERGPSSLSLSHVMTNSPRHGERTQKFDDGANFPPPHLPLSHRGK